MWRGGRSAQTGTCPSSRKAGSGDDRPPRAAGEPAGRGETVFAQPGLTNLRLLRRRWTTFGCQLPLNMPEKTKLKTVYYVKKVVDLLTLFYVIFFKLIKIDSR
uniref:(northern house mosquito) hypothetical protein n=1 Tax=Culex pipiens TaxID=7175 RepID=A0A8D8NKD8_CULPI